MTDDRSDKRRELVARLSDAAAELDDLHVVARDHAPFGSGDLLSLADELQAMTARLHEHAGHLAVDVVLHPAPSLPAEAAPDPAVAPDAFDPLHAGCGSVRYG